MESFIECTDSNLVIDSTPEKPDFPVEVIEKLESFNELNQGWRFGEGESIKLDVVKKATEVLLIGWRRGLEVDVFPSSSGGVLVVFYAGEYSLEIIVNRDLAMDLEVEKGIGYDYEIIKQKENISLSDILKSIKYLVKRLEWSLSESSPHQSMTQDVNDLEVIAFKTPVMGAESLLLR